MIKELRFGGVGEEESFLGMFGKWFVTRISTKSVKEYETRRVASIKKVLFLEGIFWFWIFPFYEKKSGNSKIYGIIRERKGFLGE